MSLNRTDLVKQMNEAASQLLRERGYISFVEVLLRMGKLTKEQYEAWRFRKLPCLEQAVTMNLAKINHLLRMFHRNARKGGLRASKTAYVSWGKAPKISLRFSKSRDPNIEEAYATHFLRPKEGAGAPHPRKASVRKPGGPPGNVSAGA
jgi:hypothetical protein